MSHLNNNPVSNLGLDEMSDRFRDSLTTSDKNDNKPDFRELDLGSPVSPLRNRHRALINTTTTTSSSSSSSGSVSGRNAPSQPQRKSDSGELSGILDSGGGGSSRGLKGHARSSSANSYPLIYSGGSSATSPLNVPPTGNICPSGRILKTGMASRSSKPDVLGTGSGNYGHGSIIRGGASPKLGGIDCAADGIAANSMKKKKLLTSSAPDPDELKEAGNQQYKHGHLIEALGLYDQAISMSPGNATYRFNKAVALMGLNRLVAAVKEFEEAIKLDSTYVKAHYRLGSLLLRLGQIESARKHICFPGQKPEETEMKKLQAVEMHLNKCNDARKVSDWKTALKECESAIAVGADSCSLLYACKAEAFLNLHLLDDANLNLANISNLEPMSASSLRSKIFGMLAESYLHFVRAQIEMAFGRFENAVKEAEKAGQIDPKNIEVSVLLTNVRLVSRARIRGNNLFKSERFTEACSAYGEGLRHDPSNSILYCNRAACWYKLGMWERSIDDCNQALSIQPNYTKALLRKAASNTKLERWVEAIRDYEVLRRELPDDSEVAESLFHAQVAFKKSRGEEVHNLKFGGEVEVVTSLEHFKASISLPGASVVHFKTETNKNCRQIAPFLDTLSGRYPSINFLKVDIEDTPAVAVSENVSIVPTVKIYRNGSRVKEIISPSQEFLESSVRHYSF
ncbi:TPR repeat-containing thioredoxin TTL1-like [Impatiens glandulifera]|uniref:TPR repeat-containing thioredoxin TTL1-like n=1 Tax=Impatiens glandulifera TaxID=253017 RepID=UPI001FB13ED9|nr:TPR repeat-containing thioredoxin TTL1-like [Impatiens glandulifera]